MGFSFRKSLKIGPVRLNVSKSGVGVSAGVKGARIGVNAKGKAYGSVGANGLTYRTQIGGAGNSKNGGDDTAENLAEDPHPAITAGGVIGVLVFIFSFFACFVNANVGVVGFIVGFLVLISSRVYSARKNKNRRMSIVQDAQISEDELVQLLAEYCHAKKLLGEDARRAMNDLLRERADFLGTGAGERL